MKREKFLIAVIVALLISNLLIIGFLVVRPKPMHGPDGPRNLIIEKLQFDAEQVEQYEALIDEHIGKRQILDEQINNSKKALYSALATDENKAMQDSIFGELAKLQSEIEVLHFSHFQDIKKLCKPEQMDKYNAFTSEIQQLFEQKAPPPPPGKP